MVAVSSSSRILQVGAPQVCLVQVAAGHVAVLQVRPGRTDILKSTVLHIHIFRVVGEIILPDSAAFNVFIFLQY